MKEINKKYCSLNSIQREAYKVGLKYKTVVSRLYNGFSLQEALNPNLKRCGGKVKYFYKGVPAFKIAENNGIPRKTFLDRVGRLGWSVEQAIRIEPDIRNRIL